MEEFIGRIQNVYPFNKKTRVNRSYKVILSLFLILSLNVNYSFSQSNNNIWLARFLEQGTVVDKLNFIAGIHEKGKMDNLKTMRSYIDSLEQNSGYKKNISVYQTLIKSYDLVEKNENVALIKLIDPIKDKYNEKIQYCFYYELVHAYYDIGFYMKASSYFVKYRELKNTLYPNLLSYTNPGTFYFEAGLYKKAIVEYKSEYENEYLSKKQDKTRMKNFLGSMSNNIGLCFGKLGEVDSAIFYFDKALVHWHNCKPNDQLYNQYLENLISGNKGGLKIQLKEYNEAIPLLKKDIKSSLKFDENNAMNSMLALSNCYISINKYHLAKEYCDKVSLLIDTVTAPSQLVYDWLITKSKIFEKNGKIKESLASINQYQTLKLKNETAQKQFKAEQYFELYQLEIDQQQLKQQELKLAKLANIETKNSRLKWVAGLALIILIGGAILMYVINRLQKKIRKQLIDKKDVAENALALKESMVKEIHHRVKNNLQVVSGLLQLQANITESEEVKETLKEGENRIFSIASIHQLLYEHPEVEEILVQEYIEKLVFQIAQVYTEKHQIKIDVENITINSEVAIPLGLILNELITNTYKHAYEKGVTGTIHIKLRKENEQYLFEYMDDGKGIPTDVDLTKAKSLGLRIVRLMSEQIKGKLKIEKGAKFSLKF